MRLTLLIGVFLLLFVSCDSIDFTDQPQGVIEYDVTYLSNKSSMPTNLLPKKITLKFRASKSITTMDGFMGMFSLSNISDFKKQTNTLLLKVMDNKYYQQGEKLEPPFFYDGIKKPEIAFTNLTKEIAGLNCKMALVTFSDTIQKPFKLYYTDDIKLLNSNKSNPFNIIDGVLIQFNIRINNIEMQLCANKYRKEPVSKDNFDIPEKYRKVSREKISAVISKLLE